MKEKWSVVGPVTRLLSVRVPSPFENDTLVDLSLTLFLSEVKRGGVREDSFISVQTALTAFPVTTVNSKILTRKPLVLVTEVRTREGDDEPFLPRS